MCVRKDLFLERQKPVCKRGIIHREAKPGFSVNDTNDAGRGELIRLTVTRIT